MSIVTSSAFLYSGFPHWRLYAWCYGALERFTKKRSDVVLVMRWVPLAIRNDGRLFFDWKSSDYDEVEALMSFTTRLYRTVHPLVYCLGLWSLITIGPLSVGPLYAEWLNVGGKVERGLTVYSVYVDTDSILLQGDIVTLWALFDYMSIQSIVGGPWLSSKTRREYDCVKERVRLMGYMTFTGNMGSGEVVYSNSDQSAWEPLAPDSIDRTLWDVACSAK